MSLLLPIAGLMSACGSTLSTDTGGSPRNSIDRRLSDARKAVPAPAPAKQLHVATVDVLQSFTASPRSILYVDTHESDEYFLFFCGDLVSGRSITGWRPKTPRVFLYD